VQRPGKRTVAAVLGGAGATGVALFALAGGPAQAEAPAAPTPDPSASAPSASAPSPSAPSPSAPSAAPTDRPERSADRSAERAQRQDELAAALAAELGIDKARVAAALEKVQAAQREKASAERTAQLKTRLDEAVQEGRLTADEAAAIRKAAEAGLLPPGGGGGRGFGGPFGGPSGHR
jgi:hypothetical protein